MKRLMGVAVCLALLAGCGGGDRSSGPETFDELSGWLEDGGECGDGDVEATLARSPGTPRATESVPVVERFGEEAVAAGLISCGGANGYISYYRFRSAEAREAAVRGRAGLISNELFCAKGPELVVNDLLGYDQTAGFCKRLGFPIHQPTHEPSPAQRREHRLEAGAARVVQRRTGQPNVYCTHLRDPLRFECEEPVGGRITYVEFSPSRGSYVIEGR